MRGAGVSACVCKQEGAIGRHLPPSVTSMICSLSKQMQFEPSALCHTELASGPLWRSNLALPEHHAPVLLWAGLEAQSSKNATHACELCRGQEHYVLVYKAALSAFQSRNFVTAQPADNTRNALTWARGCPEPNPVRSQVRVNRRRKRPPKSPAQSP